MTRIAKLAPIAFVAVSLGLITTPAPSADQPEPAPVITLQRTASARYAPAAKRPVIRVLVIGSDVREGNPRAGRADSLHIVSINTRTGAGSSIGIPRDAWVEIPGHGPGKITASLFFAGPEGTTAAVARATGLAIHYWALIDFSRFRKLVDLLGGVELTVPYPMSDVASGASFGAGKTRMNGTQALAFARARKTIPGGDFGRSANQGRLLLAALVKFRKEVFDPVRLSLYLRGFRRYVASNVPLQELFALADVGRRADPWKIKNVVVPGRTGTAGGSSVVFLQPGDLFAKVKPDGVL